MSSFDFSLVSITVIALTVYGLSLLIKILLPALHKHIGVYFPLMTANCAVLGSVLLNVQNGFGLVEAVIFAFSSAVGFTVAALIFAGIRQRLVFSAPPKCFQGLPLLLLSASLVALAFSGFSGITLG